MLKIVVPKRTIEYYDQETETFIDVDDKNSSDVTLCLEHSLYSLSKWESIWHKPFLKEDSLTKEKELYDYIRVMTVWPKNVDPEVYTRLTEDNINQIVEYIKDPMTATTFSNHRNIGKAQKKSVITSELIYYSMFTYGIPLECEKWHLNKLMTLIHVFDIKNQDPKSNKMSKSAVASQYKSLNAARRAKYNSRG